MHGDFSRLTFDPAAGYRAVLLQQGRMLLDADFNEQVEITAYHDERRMHDLLGPSGGPADGAGFALVDAAGAEPSGTAWKDLFVTPGRFYVDGVLAEAEVAEGLPGHPLAAQPYLPVTSELHGLREPGDDGLYAVVLDVWNHHVTPEEAPRLLESALGGPDTATRAQTVWQVTLERVDDGESCAGARDAAFLTRIAPTLTASLADVAAVSDPCEITTANGYRRLENQLYRVQIHQVRKGPEGRATYVWSRENGSVYAGVDAIGPTAIAGMDAELTLDREGRDEELSIGEGDIVEMTSTDRELHGAPGFLATAGAPVGLVLPIAWSDDAPADLAALGRAPIVRRWEGAPRVAGPGEEPLEDGVQVAFGDGDFHTGDHWLIPARTVRLVYGASTPAGTLEWPADDLGAPLPQPPLGPVHHRATIALLVRNTANATAGWTLRADCRRLFAPLTDLVAIDLLGGDAQGAVAGQPLPEVIRVAVRNGGRAVVGAQVRFSAIGGHLDRGAPTSSDPNTVDLPTDEHGHADVRWLLDAGGPATQVLAASLLDDAGSLVGAQVHATGRLLESRDRVPGLHVQEVLTLFDGKELGNDTVVDPNRLTEGIAVVLDGPLDPRWAKAKPVLTVSVDLPWPDSEPERVLWGVRFAGTQRVELRAVVAADERVVRWQPVDDGLKFLLDRVVSVAGTLGMERVQARLTLLGNVIADKRGELYVNGRAFGKLRPDGSTALVLPSVDDVHGADFTMWFWLAGSQENPPRIVVNPDRLLFGAQTETRAVAVTNAGGSALLVDAETRTLSPPGTVIYSVRPSRLEVPPQSSAELAVTSQRGGAAAVFAGELVLTTNDPRQPHVSVPLSSPGLGLFGVVPTATGVLRLAPVRKALVAAAGPEATRGATGTAPLVKAVRERADQPRLLLAIAPGFDAAVEELRRRLAEVGLEVEVEIVDGDPADLVRRAAAGDVVLDGVVGDEATGAALAGDGGRVLALVEL